MKKIISIVLVLALSLTAAFSLTACSGNSAAEEGVTIAIPNDTTNEARALLLLEDLGYIKLKDGAGITATPLDVEENPYNIEFSEVEAAQLPNVLPDVDYAIINSNYAIEADLNPVEDALALEGSSSAYSNILAVKEGNENSELIKALVAALESQQVADFIASEYGGAVVSVVDEPTDGYDASVDYDALSGQTVSVAASPTPHAEILAVVQEILAEKNITLEINEFTSSPTTWLRAARSTPTTSSTRPIWTISMPRTAPTSSPRQPSMWSPLASMAASRRAWTRSRSKQSQADGASAPSVVVKKAFLTR